MRHRSVRSVLPSRPSEVAADRLPAGVVTQSHHGFEFLSTRYLLSRFPRGESLPRVLSRVARDLGGMPYCRALGADSGISSAARARRSGGGPSCCGRAYVDFALRRSRRPVILRPPRAALARRVCRGDAIELWRPAACGWPRSGFRAPVAPRRAAVRSGEERPQRWRVVHSLSTRPGVLAGQRRSASLGGLRPA